MRRDRERILSGPGAQPAQGSKAGLGRAGPRAGQRPAGAGGAPRGDRPQPRGAAGAEAPGAAGAHPARRGLLLRRDRRDHRLQPDQDQPLPRRGARAIPQLLAAAATDGAAPRWGRCCPPTAMARPRSTRRPCCKSTCAPAPAAARPCAPTGRRPGPRRRWRRRCRSPARSSSVPTTPSPGSPHRFTGAGATDSALSQVAAAGGTRGAGMAALAKVLAICVGTAGGAAACMATGVVPAPLAIDRSQAKAPVLERPDRPERRVRMERRCRRRLRTGTAAGLTAAAARAAAGPPGPALLPDRLQAPSRADPVR